MADNFTMPADESTPEAPTENPQTNQAPEAAYPEMIIRAVESEYLAKHARAVTNLNNYLQHPVGIGEHPDVVGECIKLFEDISAAEGVLTSIRKSLNYG